jgi:hypothetical protein
MSNPFAGLQLDTKAQIVIQKQAKRKAPVRAQEIARNNFGTPTLASQDRLDEFATPSFHQYSLQEAKIQFDQIQPVKQKPVTPVPKPRVVPKPIIRTNDPSRLLSPRTKETAKKNQTFYEMRYQNNNNNNNNNNNMTKNDSTEWKSKESDQIVVFNPDELHIETNNGFLQQFENGLTGTHLVMNKDEYRMHNHGLRLIDSRCARSRKERRKIIKTINKTNPSFTENLKHWYSQAWLGKVVQVDRGNVIIDPEEFDLGDDPYYQQERYKIEQWELENNPDKYQYDENTGQFYSTEIVSEFQEIIEQEHQLPINLDLERRTKYDPLAEVDELVSSITKQVQHSTSDPTTTTLLTDAFIGLSSLFRRYCKETEERIQALESRPIGTGGSPFAPSAPIPPPQPSTLPERPRPAFLAGIGGGAALKKPGDRPALALPGKPAGAPAVAPKPAGGSNGIDFAAMGAVKLRSSKDPLPIKQNPIPSQEPSFPQLRPTNHVNSASTQIEPAQPAQPSWLSAARLRSSNNNGPAQPQLTQPQLSLTLGGLRKTGGVPERKPIEPTKEVNEFQAVFLRKNSTSTYIQQQTQLQFMKTPLPGVIFSSPRANTLNKYNSKFAKEEQEEKMRQLSLNSSNNIIKTPQIREPTPEERQEAIELARIRAEEELLKIHQEQLAAERRALEMKAKYSYAQLLIRDEFYAHPGVKALATPILDSKVPDIVQNQFQQSLQQTQVAFPLMISTRKKKSRKSLVGPKSTNKKAQVFALDELHSMPILNHNTSHIVNNLDPFDDIVHGDSQQTTFHATPLPETNNTPECGLVDSIQPLTPVLSPTLQDKCDDANTNLDTTLTDFTLSENNTTLTTKGAPIVSKITPEEELGEKSVMSLIDIVDLPIPTVDTNGNQIENKSPQIPQPIQPLTPPNPVQLQMIPPQRKLQQPVTPVMNRNMFSPSVYGFSSPYRQTQFTPASTPTRRGTMTPKMHAFEAMIAEPLRKAPPAPNHQRFQHIISSPQLTTMRRAQNEQTGSSFRANTVVGQVNNDERNANSIENEQLSDVME